MCDFHSLWEKVGQSLVCSFWISYWKLWMSLSLNIFCFHCCMVSHIVFVSEPRTLHLGSESFSVLKSELVFFLCPWAAALEGETVANPPCSLHTKVLLAKRKRDGKCYAIKVLQKKVILNRREVMIFFVLIPALSLCSLCYVLWHLINEFPCNFLFFTPAKAHYGWT